MKINLIIIMFLTFVISSCSSTQKISQSNVQGQLKKELIGTWEFEILRTEEGEKIDTIWHPVGGYEIPKGPLLTFKENDTFLMQFTPKNTDTGK